MEDSDSNKTQTFKDLSRGAFEKCLQLLKGPSDEERFTGLLIVSKAIRRDDSEKIRKVFDTIGFNFINRLASSKQGKPLNLLRNYSYLNSRRCNFLQTTSPQHSC